MIDFECVYQYQLVKKQNIKKIEDNIFWTHCVYVIYDM